MWVFIKAELLTGVDFSTGSARKEFFFYCLKHGDNGQLEQTFEFQGTLCACLSLKHMVTFFFFLIWQQASGHYELIMVFFFI